MNETITYRELFLLPPLDVPFFKCYKEKVDEWQRGLVEYSDKKKGKMMEQRIQFRETK